MVATVYKKPDMVKYLINHGADVNINTYHGTTLTIAAWNGNADIARILLQNGANPNAVVLDGYTPLTIAAYRDSAEVIKVLAEFGAKLEYIHPVTSYTALSTATYYGHKDAAIALIKLGANVNYIDANGFSVLDWSQIGSHDDITKALVDNGAKIEMKKNNTVPAVMLMVLAHENIPMINFLVNKGISVNAFYEKMPILVWCAKCNVPKSAMELIKLGADISAKDIDGHTALDWAIISGQKQLAQAINPKVDVNKFKIPKDPNTLDQATLVGELINDQYYQGTVTSVQGLESLLSSSLTTDTSLMQDLRSDKVFKNPEIKTDTTVVHPDWENVSEFENFDKQIQSDMESMSKSLKAQPGVTTPAVPDQTVSQPAPANTQDIKAIPSFSSDQK
jgi:ankyrin repeat protein